MTTLDRYRKALVWPSEVSPGMVVLGMSLRECRDLMRERLAKIDSWVYPMANVGYTTNRYGIVVRGIDRFGIRGFDNALLGAWKLVQKETRK